MTTMVCSNCGRTGIYWKNLTGLPWTYCPHCEGTNCQRPLLEPNVFDEEEEDNDNEG